ncbi:MAG: DUF1684 domain-containing protein [Bifidobacterium aquikefiri]|uniref:DUF1684 domain-containing protein n=1 Tax=Bifidobacterium aquikefiri TaxID=1653207 RepID=A0A261G6C2_9BIFI|nr:DUF1684 domain-containing protein [Bifidobacterium aquikefiri]OZG66968.1 hypothetical protein BAQU_1040 [Bifidobacterium aquikefiri]
MGLDVHSAVLADNYIQQWNIWHDQRIEELTSPHGYLAPTSITWVADGESKTIEGIPGRWSSNEDVLRYEPDLLASPAVTNAGNIIREAITFKPENFGEQALAYLHFGDIRIEVNSQTDLIHHDAHRFWIRIKDPASPSRRDFRGIGQFPLDRKWHIKASFSRSHSGDLDVHDSVVKTVLQSYPVLGYVEFSYGGQHHSLVVSNVFGHASIFFSDETSGKESYAIGRVLQLDALSLDDLQAIDFNYAINYPCAFSIFCTCPIPSKRNHLPFAVTAGEQTPADEAQY